MRLLLAASLLLLAACGSPARPTSGTILVFTHTTGYRHDSIPAGIVAIRSMARQHGLAVVNSEDPRVFSTDSLRQFRAIVLFSTTTDPKNPASEWLVNERRTALQQFVACGGGIIAIHAAADSHYHWPWFGKLIGGRFAGHPPGTSKAKLSVIDRSHPANRGLPPTFERVDEWYSFDGFDPSSKLLLVLDPRSLGEMQDSPRPIAWAREGDGGRLFYTALGHTRETYTETFFLQHLASGLDWVLARPKVRSSTCSPM